MITRDEVKRIAELARLGLSEKEIGKYQKDLSSIFDYMEKLKEADISGIEPTSHSLAVENVTRKDAASSAFAEASAGKEKLKGTNEKLLKLMPDKKEGYLKVKSIF